MSKSSIVRTLLAATFVASLCAGCNDGNKDHAGQARQGTLGGDSERTGCLNGIDAKSSTERQGNSGSGCLSASSPTIIDI